MAFHSKSRDGAAELQTAELFARHPVLTLEKWAKALGGPKALSRAAARARYHLGTGRLRRVARGVYAVLPPGARARSFQPDPYLVAAALRTDAILSHHAALDLLGAAQSVFSRFTYLTSSPRRVVRLDGTEWVALAHPTALVKARKLEFGVTTLDRQGVTLKVTGPERTLVDGFAGFRWVGGLEEHVESAASLRDLDLDQVARYLRLLNEHVLYGALGWFLESHLEVAHNTTEYLNRFARHVPRQPSYLGRRVRGAKLEKRWNVLVPEHLSTRAGFEGAPR